MLRASWEREEAPALERRIAALDAELEQRIQERVAGVEDEAPAYVEQALGPRPEHERPLGRLREAVGDLEGYRARHGIEDAEGRLGPLEWAHVLRPDRHRAEEALEVARQEIERTQPGDRSPFDLHREHPEQEWESQREHDWDHGPRRDHDRDMGPSLGLGM